MNTVSQREAGNRLPADAHPETVLRSWRLRRETSEVKPNAAHFGIARSGALVEPIGV